MVQQQSFHHIRTIGRLQLTIHDSGWVSLQAAKSNPWMDANINTTCKRLGTLV